MKPSSVLFLSIFNACYAVYFVQEESAVCLHLDADIGSTAGRLFAYPNAADNCTASLQYEVVDSPGTFSVNGSGWVILDEKLGVNVPASVTLNVSVQCTSMDKSTKVAFTSVIITITDTVLERPSVGDTDLIEDICFHGVPPVLKVEENAKDVVIAKLGQGRDLPHGLSRTYRVNKPKSKFSVNRTTSELILTKALDRESLGPVTANGNIANITGIQPLKITCTLTSGDDVFPPQKRRISVNVTDVNDSPPVFPNYNDAQYIEKTLDIASADADSLKVDEVVLDSDSWYNGSHQVTVVKDPGQVCRCTITCLAAKPGKTMCRLYIQLVDTDQITTPTYRCIVGLTDTSFVPPPGSKLNSTALIVVNMRNEATSDVDVHPQADTLTVDVYRNATRLARVLQLPPSRHPRTTYILSNSVFKVTKATGILYVNDRRALNHAPNSLVLDIGTTSSQDVRVIVNLIGDAGKPDDACEESCSRHDSMTSCTGSCGLGLQSGGCEFRGSDTNSNMDPEYGTCTHNMATCPDRICDELEDMYPMLCPQDCATEVNGAALLNFKNSPPRGIVMAQSPCWCETDDYGVICTCMPNPQPHLLIQSAAAVKSTTSTTTLTSTAPVTPTTMKSTTPSSADPAVLKNLSYVPSRPLPNASSPVTIRSTENITDIGQMVALASEERSGGCERGCATAIGLGLGAFISIAFSLFMLWFTKKRNFRRKNNVKRVGSVVSMPALPSDYLDSVDAGRTYSSPEWSSKGPLDTTDVSSVKPENIKWEIPRESLILDKTLGEGEFGLVVKARAKGINGDNTERDVAVKMLKHYSTQTEEQDLWSEFNILKDVSHPNVIQLLGACTSDGPFYVIVEYCEHGCLLMYLRRSRLEENGYVNQRWRHQLTSPDPKEQTDPSLVGELLTMRDLLMFAWQIAKGMCYLSEIKLVHRDLAARNILMSSRRLLKISDFGLTRDVYEADTYLKKSRGRIPVKWLAPESLYAQIYTTRSDVWSFGIVLWEIVTLGAPPYPGIPPERLYKLLIGGYRMDRPENCPDEMYAVMQKCWKTDAADRPTFKSLADIFDRILQQKTGYLDLNSTSGMRNDLYTSCFNPGNHDQSSRDNQTRRDRRPHDVTTDTANEINISTVCNNAYLTPSSTLSGETTRQSPRPNNKLHIQDEESSSPLLVRTITENGRKMDERESSVPLFERKTSEKSSKKPNVIYPCEKLSLLENGTARFMNVYDVNDDVDQPRIHLE